MSDSKIPLPLLLLQQFRDMHQYSLHVKTTNCFSLSVLQRCAPVQPTCPDSVLLFYFSSTAEMHSNTSQYSTQNLNPIYTAYIQQHFHSLPRLQRYVTTIPYDDKADGAKCTASTELHAGSYSGTHHQHKDSQHNPDTLYMIQSIVLFDNVVGNDPLFPVSKWSKTFQSHLYNPNTLMHATHTPGGSPAQALSAQGQPAQP